MSSMPDERGDEKTVPSEKVVKASIILDEVTDFIKDNNPQSIKESTNLMLTCLKKKEALRLELRIQNRMLRIELGSEEFQYDKPYQHVMQSISEYIREINQLIQRGDDKTNKINAHKATFLMNEMDRAMKGETIFTEVGVPTN